MNNRTAVNHKIRKHFNELIYNVARYTEIVLSIVILIVIALSSADLYNSRYFHTEYGHGLFYHLPVTGFVPCGRC